MKSKLLHKIVLTCICLNFLTTTVVASEFRLASTSAVAAKNNLQAGLSSVKYTGYFDDVPSFFNDDRSKRISAGSTPSSQLPIFNNTDSMGSNISYYWGGYFIPDESGKWDFQITSDDAAFLWIGNVAVSAYWGGYATALIAIPGAHPPQTKNRSIELEANKIYPFRIFYGNAAGTGSFKLEVMPPSFKTEWDINLEGLIWHSNFLNREECTNFGISYLLSAKLGYEIVNVPLCKNNPAKIFDKNSPEYKPDTPLLDKLQIANNKINLTVNIGSGYNSPDKVFILSPALGLNKNNSMGKISGSSATFSLPIIESAAGKSPTIQVISSRNGVESSPFVRLIKIPVAQKVQNNIKAAVKPTPTIKTVICKKGAQTRTFAGKSCPPGWN